MKPKPSKTGILFAGVVIFFLAMLSWWVFFLLRESSYLDEATELTRSGRYQEALRILGADIHGDFQAKANRLRLMFTSEGLALGLCVLVGIVLLYRTLLRENKMRLQQERFLTGATHHLKTPLATVRLGIESMLAGSMPPEKQNKYLQAMLREVDHLEKDLTNLLTAGGLEASSQDVRLSLGNLAEDVHAAADSMRDRFDAAGIELRTDIESEVMVERDREAIHLILHNLLDNAVKYSSSGDCVDLALSSGEQKARLRIIDEGRGIASEELPHVFDRFYRGSSREHKGGSGVGLFLVREIVTSHSGTVSATSSGTGRGTEFIVELPLSKRSAS